MKFSIVSLALVSLASCAGSAQPQPAAPAKDPKMAALGLLMKNEINPAFSKVMFLVFHGQDMEEDPERLKAEMARYGESLRKSLGRLRAWTHPPTVTAEGRDVFFAYALSVDKSATRLLEAIDRADTQAAAAQLESIAKTCNNCHHFFRLNIEDSVVGPGVVSDGAAPVEPDPAAVQPTDLLPGFAP